MNVDTNNRRIIVAVTGASGAIYATRLLKASLEIGLEVDLVCSDYGKRLLIEECDLNVKSDSIKQWMDDRWGAQERPGKLTLHNERELGATIASGSQIWRGMVVVPCSMKSLAGIAGGLSMNLVERAADVTLKEGRPLILVPRETPLNLIHLENMTRAARAGARILPAMPAFYYKPETFDDLADFIVTRIFALLQIEHQLFRAWEG